MSNAITIDPRIREALQLIEDARGKLTQASCRLRFSDGKEEVQIAHAEVTDARNIVLSHLGLGLVDWNDLLLAKQRDAA